MEQIRIIMHKAKYVKIGNSRIRLHFHLGRECRRCGKRFIPLPTLTLSRGCFYCDKCLPNRLKHKVKIIDGVKVFS